MITISIQENRNKKILEFSVKYLKNANKSDNIMQNVHTIHISKTFDDLFLKYIKNGIIIITKSPIKDNKI